MGLLIFFAFAAACIVVAGAASIILKMRYPPRKTYGVAIARNLPTTPEEIGMDYGEDKFTYRDGTRTIVWDIRADGPEDTAVIITHGFGDSRYGALTWAPLFRKVAGRILVYDLRAHGDSTARRGTYSALERDDLIELVQKVHLPPRVLLFGYSMGAVISISAASVLKDRVAGVVADGPYRKPMEPVIGHLWQTRQPAYPMTWLVDLHLRFWWRRYLPFDRVEQVKHITCPLLVLHGTADPICKLESARQLVDAAPAGATLVTFEGGEHLDLAERDPERYLGAIEQFTKELSDVQ